MPDDKTKTGGQDRRRISTSQDYEVRDWAAKFGVTKEQLVAAVKSGLATGGGRQCRGLPEARVTAKQLQDHPA